MLDTGKNNKKTHSGLSFPGLTRESSPDRRDCRPDYRALFNRRLPQSLQRDLGRLQRPLVNTV